MILKSRFHLEHDDAHKSSNAVSAHIRRGLDFYNSINRVPEDLRAVHLYYCYLNLVTAVVLCYRPHGWEEYRRHGVSDNTPALSHIDLQSEVLTVTRGAVTLFSSIISNIDLYKRRLRLADVLVPIESIGGELSSAFKIHASELCIDEKISPPDESNQVRSTITISGHLNPESLSNDTEPDATEIATLLLPHAQEEYTINAAGRSVIELKSKQSWTSEDLSDAEKFHAKHAIKVANLAFDPLLPNAPAGLSVLRYLPNRPIIPGPTAHLLYAFFLSSLARYRPTVSGSTASNRLNLLHETFLNESPSTMLPLIRNMLYREELCLTRSKKLGAHE